MKCSRQYNFIFHWSRDPNSTPQNLSLTKAFLRVYVESIDRVIPEGQKVMVNASIKLQAASSSEATNSTPATFVKRIEVESTSGGWLELNLLEELANIWDPATNETLFNTTLIFDVDCNQQRKVPLKVVNPVALPVGENQRNRKFPFQPFFVISVNDIRIKTLIERSKNMISVETPFLMDETVTERKKRSLEPLCHMENYVANFSALGLGAFILKPEVVNIRQCKGSCSANYAHQSLLLTTNHARLMASAVSIHENVMPIPNPNPPKVPCCSAVKYAPAYLLMGYPNSIEVNLFSDFVVTECGCR